MNSIIIPHRNRNRQLALCIWSIAMSAVTCDVDDWEIVVVDNGSDYPPLASRRHVRVVRDLTEMPVFNKSRLLNLGIHEAAGDVLTFLDADALVGATWLEWPLLAFAACPDLVRLCYRVRYYPSLSDLTGDDTQKDAECQRAFREIERDRQPVANRLFARDYDCLDHGWEATGHPGHNSIEPGRSIHGNSQFSIRREHLGDLRFDEEYAGHGLEDLDFNQQIFAKFGKDYWGYLATDPQRNLIHLRHTYQTDWKAPYSYAQNAERYQRKWKDVKPL